jgi:hypothetical protein
MMRGYLLKEQTFTPGEETFIESVSSENNYAVAFEDETDTGYFYAIEKNDETGEQRILDAVHIYNVEETADQDTPWNLKIMWSRDWLKCALILNGKCQAVFDFEAQGGYNLNEFPPPNTFWTRGERTLTNDMVKAFFQ